MTYTHTHPSMSTNTGGIIKLTFQQHTHAAGLDSYTEELTNKQDFVSAITKYVVDYKKHVIWSINIWITSKSNIENTAHHTRKKCSCQNIILTNTFFFFFQYFTHSKSFMQIKIHFQIQHLLKQYRWFFFLYKGIFKNIFFFQKKFLPSPTVWKHKPWPKQQVAI